MKPQNLVMVQGDCFTSIMDFTDDDGTAIDVSGWTFTGQIRDRYDSTVLLASFIFDNAGLPTNETKMSLTAATTETFPVTPSKAPGVKIPTYLSYDIKADIDGCEYTIAFGAVIFWPSVTQP